MTQCEANSLLEHVMVVGENQLHKWKYGSLSIYY